MKVGRYKSEWDPWGSLYFPEKEEGTMIIVPVKCVVCEQMVPAHEAQTHPCWQDESNCTQVVRGVCPCGVEGCEGLDWILEGQEPF